MAEIRIRVNEEQRRALKELASSNGYDAVSTFLRTEALKGDAILKVLGNIEKDVNELKDRVGAKNAKH